MRTREVTRALSPLVKSFKHDPEAAIADPLWQRLRAQDTRFLEKTPPSLRLDLLRYQYARFPEDPWGPLTAQDGSSSTWPLWDVPAWEIGWGSNPDEAAGIFSSRVLLPHGWSLAFYADAAEVRLQCHDVYFDDETGHDDTAFPLDRVLTLCFSDPQADPRKALGGDDVTASPDNGWPMRYRGVRLYTPEGDEVYVEDDFFSDDGDASADADTIATFAIEDSLFVRDADDDPEPRPLFASTPIIDTDMENDGLLVCAWRTACYVPVNAECGERQRWSYEKHSLDIVEHLQGTSVYDLVPYAWRYKTMRDLEGEIAKAISLPRNHHFLSPLYESLLFRQ